MSDNASDDDTDAVLDELADPRLTTIRQPSNIGPIGNWNACVAAARGDYIVMLSDDDFLAPHFLDRCGALLATNVDLPVLVALGDVFDSPTGLTKPAVRSRVLESGVRDGSTVLSEFLLGHISPQMCTVAIKTSLLRARGGFPADWPHAGDLVSWVPLLLEGKAGFINESCGTYRIHMETQTANFALFTRLDDIERLARVIVEDAEREVDDPVVVAEITSLARRYVARNFIGHITSQRAGGASRREIASAAWTARRQLLGASMSDLRILPRPLALYVLPMSGIEIVRRVKRRLGVL